MLTLNDKIKTNQQTNSNNNKKKNTEERKFTRKMEKEEHRVLVKSDKGRCYSNQDSTDF